MISAIDIVIGHAPSTVRHDHGRAGSGTVVAGPLSFSHADGECVMLRGRNGSGKTTLMKTIAGLLPPLSGTFETGGRAILVPTRIPKVRGFTVEEFVRAGTLSEYGAFRKLDDYSIKAIDEAMEVVRITEEVIRKSGFSPLQKFCSR